jgi:hypothetical protein
MLRANSSFVTEPLMYAEPRKGEQRDGIVAARGVEVSTSGVAPWPNEALSDHRPLDAVCKLDERNELFIRTLNINGTTLSSHPGRTFDECTVSTDLLAAFCDVWSRNVETFFAPMAESDKFDPSKVATALRFWKGPTVRDLNIKARFVSPFLQGSNDIYELASELATTLAAGVSPIDAARATADSVKIDGIRWKPMHELPNSVETGERIEHDDREQQHTNLCMFFYYLAVVATDCPDGFKQALESAPSKPTADAIVGYIGSVLVTEEPDVFALQEVPAALVSSIRGVCAEQGYVVHAAPSAKEAGVVTIVKTGIDGGRFETIDRSDGVSHRALESSIRIDDERSVAVLNIHGDTGGFTRERTRLFSQRHPCGPVLVVGDFQIGKVDGGHARVMKDFADDLGVPIEHLTSSPPLLTRSVPTTPNVFCPQFKFKNVDCPMSTAWHSARGARHTPGY